MDRLIRQIAPAAREFLLPQILTPKLSRQLPGGEKKDTAARSSDPEHVWRAVTLAKCCSGRMISATCICGAQIHLWQFHQLCQACLIPEGCAGLGGRDHQNLDSFGLKLGGVWHGKDHKMEGTFTEAILTSLAPCWFAIQS